MTYVYIANFGEGTRQSPCQRRQASIFKFIIHEAILQLSEE